MIIIRFFFFVFLFPSQYDHLFQLQSLLYYYLSIYTRVFNIMFFNIRHFNIVTKYTKFIYDIRVDVANKLCPLKIIYTFIY